MNKILTETISLSVADGTSMSLYVARPHSNAKH